MKAIKRYICLLSTLFTVYILYRSLLLFNDHGYWLFRSNCISKLSNDNNVQNFTLPSLSSRKSYYQMEKIHHAKQHESNDDDEDNTGLHCRMDSKCFNFNQCPHGSNIRIYIYPYDIEHTSVLFNKIVTFIRQSKYYEPDPNKACLFISNMDTLDRDRRSYNFNKYSTESMMKLMNEGRNHLMFNLYSGSWPDYNGKYCSLSLFI